MKKLTWTSEGIRAAIRARLFSSSASSSELLNVLPGCPAASLHNHLSTLISSNQITKTATFPAIYSTCAVNFKRAPLDPTALLAAQVSPAEPRGHFYRGAR